MGFQENRSKQASSNPSRAVASADKESSQKTDSVARIGEEASMQHLAMASPQIKQLKAYQAMADLSSSMRGPAGAKGAPIVQRVIDDAAAARLDHSLVAGPPKPAAVVTKDADGVIFHVSRKAGGGLEIQSNGSPLADITIDNLKSQYSWGNEAIKYKAGKEIITKKKGADSLKRSPGTPAPGALTVSEFENDDLSLVHHTTGGGSADHLTVENAHISAMHHIKDMGAIDGFNKGSKTKPEHETLMKAYESTATDNLNFFGSLEKKDRLEINLAQYLTVIRKAMDNIADVPPVYGVEVVRAANALAGSKGMNPTELYIPKGAGQERQLFKAALNMQKMGLLAVPAVIVAAFEGYAQPTPQLTVPGSAPKKVVKEGESEWTELQNQLVTQHLPALLVYLNSVR